MAAIVGGAYTQARYGTGERFDPVEAERQREAVHFLNENVFTVPAWILDRSILRRIEPQGAVDRIREAQMRVLGSLMSQPRLNRLIEYEALADDPAEMYGLAEMVQDLRAGIWSDFTGSGSVAVDVYRRNLQRGKVELIRSLLHPTATGEEAPEPLLTDLRPVLRGELRWLRTTLADALPRAANEITRLHIGDLQSEVERALGEG